MASVDPVDAPDADTPGGDRPRAGAPARAEGAGTTEQLTWVAAAYLAGIVLGLLLALVL
jgi:hypothetical protein